MTSVENHDALLRHDALGYTELDDDSDDDDVTTRTRFLPGMPMDPTQQMDIPELICHWSSLSELSSIIAPDVRYAIYYKWAGVIINGVRPPFLL